MYSWAAEGVKRKKPGRFPLAVALRLWLTRRDGIDSLDPMRKFMLVLALSTTGLAAHDSDDLEVVAEALQRRQELSAQ
jgi:hypothetical protein